MRRTFAAVAIAVTAVVGMAGTAAAASPHFIGQPVVTVGAQTVTVSGSVAGLGNEDIDVTVDAAGIASIECSNYGGQVAPGQDTAVTVSGSQTGIEVINGRAAFNVTTVAPTDPAGADVCPNPLWTADIVAVDFSSVTLTVIQAGEVVLTRTYLV
jgi:hypothetical protein